MSTITPAPSFGDATSQNNIEKLCQTFRTSKELTFTVDFSSNSDKRYFCVVDGTKIKNLDIDFLNHVGDLIKQEYPNLRWSKSASIFREKTGEFLTEAQDGETYCIDPQNPIIFKITAWHAKIFPSSEKKSSNSQ